MSAEQKVKLSQLEAANYEGEDLSLSISLREYGFASRMYLRKTGDIAKGSIKVIFRVYPDNASRVSPEMWFNSRVLKGDLNWRDEWSHLSDDDDRFFKWMDLTAEEFELETLSRKVNLLLDYYGVLNVFGLPCSSFQIAGL